MLSVVIPAHNEAGLDRARRSTDVVEALERAGIDYEVLVVDDCEHGRHRGRRPSRSAVENPRVRYHRSHNPRGFGFTVRAGLDVFEGDAVAIVMADGSDDPDDLVRYHGVLEEGYDCAFGSRFVRGSHGPRLPEVQARAQPRRQLGHPRALPPRLQRHDQRLQGVPARGDRDRPAAALEPLQPHGRDPAEGDRARPQLRGRPDLAGAIARQGESKLSLQEMGSRYAFIVLYVLPRAPSEPRRLRASCG